MKYYTLLSLLFLFLSTLHAQNKPVENEKILRYKNKLREHRRNLDSLAFYTQKLDEEAKRTNNTSAQLDALLSYGSIAMRKGDLKKSNQYYFQLIALAKETKATNLVYPAMNNLALNYRRLQKNDSAYYYFTKLYKHYLNNYNPMGMAQTMMNLGISQMQNQQLDSAVFYLSESLRNFKNMKQAPFIPSNLSLLAEVYYQKEDYQKAITLADSSQVLSENLKMKRNYARNYSLLSRAYDKIGDSKKAAYYKDLESNLPITMGPNSHVMRLNEKYDKEAALRRTKIFNKNLEDRKFYQSNLFIALAGLGVLLVVLIVLYQKNQRIKKENESLQQLLKKYKENTPKVMTQEVHKILLNNKTTLDSSKILYVKSDGHYVEFYLKNEEKPVVDRNRLKEISVILPQNNFMRIHRSYILNINEIKILNSTQIMITNGTWIPISRKHKEELKLILNKK